MTLRLRDLVLIPVPFTDLTATKRRPVLVLSCEAHHAGTDDMVVAALTPNREASRNGIDIDTLNLVEGSLPRPSRVLVGKIYTLHRSLAIRVFGRLDEDAFARGLGGLDTVLGRAAEDDQVLS